MNDFRIETDSMGHVKVPADALWGAQTERSRQNFQIGEEKMPLEVIYALVEIKKAAAKVNLQQDRLSEKRSHAIVKACDAILAGKYTEAFPLKVWQTGSGTQTNMNVNEAIAHLCNQSNPDLDVHPNDHVNLSQSSNDTFPSAMHIAASKMIHNHLLPEGENWKKILLDKQGQYENTLKVGRTHLQDATPLTFGQEISGWYGMIEKNMHFIDQSSHALQELALGGTAVGTGINADPSFGEKIAKTLSEQLQMEFSSDSNKFFALTSHSGLNYVHGAIRSLAADLLKIVNDIRWLASGPRAGLCEINIPENEPGSSIMPGKVNPTQSEALSMATMQVMGNDTVIQFAASQGNFELNVFKPVIIYNFLQSVHLLNDAMRSFRIHCLEGMTANEKRMQKMVDQSLMTVTALSPHIGYEKSAKIAHYAHDNQVSIKEAAVTLGFVDEKSFSEWVNTSSLLGKSKQQRINEASRIPDSYER